MKRLTVLCFLLIFFFSGCSEGEDGFARGLRVRERLQSGTGCSFDAQITADYGERINIFSLACEADSQGNLDFTVIEPESIAGITGKVSIEGGHLTFDDQILAFPMMADGQISPVAAPWIFLHTLLGGYLSSWGSDGEYLRLTMDDSFEEDALQVDIWLDENEVPVRGEILYDGRRILSLDVKNFVYQ